MTRAGRSFIIAGVTRHPGRLAVSAALVAGVALAVLPPSPASTNRSPSLTFLDKLILKI